MFWEYVDPTAFVMFLWLTGILFIWFYFGVILIEKDKDD